MVSIIPLIDRIIPEKYPVFGHSYCLKLLTNFLVTNQLDAPISQIYFGMKL